MRIKIIIPLFILFFLPIVYGAASSFIIETSTGDISFNTSIIAGSSISCNDVNVDSGDACNPGGAGGSTDLTDYWNQSARLLLYSNFTICSNNEILKMNGADWNCEADDTSSTPDTNETVRTDALYSNITSFLTGSGDNLGNHLATQNVNLSSYNITDISTLHFDNTGCDNDATEGAVCWNSDKQTLNIVTGLGNVIQVGQEMTGVGKNAEGSTIYEGQVVYLSGVQGEMPTIKLADASDGTKIHAPAVVTIASCANNAVCPITTFGYVHDLDTSGWLEGDDLYITADGSGNMTNVSPSFPNYALHIGKVTRVHGSAGIVLVLPEIDIGDGVVVNSLGVINDLTVTGDINATNSLFLDGITLKPLDEKSSKINGPAYGIYMTGPSGQNLPHFILQSGGHHQATTVLRSMMIANEIAGFHNTTDATDCVNYMAEIGETLQIDCNTTTTGADLLVSDDFQVVGDTWMKDKEGEWHYMTRELSNLDDIQENIILGQYNHSVNDTHYTLTHKLGDDIQINIDHQNTIKNMVTENIAITSGTNKTPINNYIYYQTAANPTLTRATSSGGSNTVHIANILQGTTGNYYLYDIAEHNNDEAIAHLHEWREDDGTTFKSGFTTESNPTLESINFTVGSYWYGLKKITISNTIDSITNGFYWINNTGEFEQCTDFSCINQYNDGTVLPGSSWFIVVCGVIKNGGNTGRMLCVPMNTPNDPYSLAEARRDDDNVLTYTTSNANINKHFLPLVELLIDTDNGDLGAFGDGDYHRSIVGVTESIAGAGGTSSHAALDDLDFASAGHTGFEGDLVNEAGLYSALSDVTEFIETSDAATLTTLDTGEGANELFDMNQNVLTTNDVTFNNITSEAIIFEKDTTNHKIFDNTTCIIIQGDTSTLRIC